MTTASDSERAAEVIAAYGGDAARWPDAERAAVLVAVAADPALARARDDAGRLDALLDEWVVDERAQQASVAPPRARPARGWRWAAAGSIAAALAATVMLVQPDPAPVLPNARPAAATAVFSDDAAFAELFTPTPDEETII